MGATPEVLRDLQFWFRRIAARPDGKFSNFNEQAIIDKYVDKLGIRNQVAVDVGAGDGIRSSNTYHLFANGWRGIGIEADRAKYQRLTKTYSSFDGVAAIHAAVQPDTVCDLLASHGVAREFGVLSLDIDGNDYWVLDAILDQYRPQLIVSEYNEKIPPPLKFVVNYDPTFYLRHHFFGYSIAKLDDLLTKHDYVLLEVEYNNVFLAPRASGATGKTVAAAYAEGYRDRPDRHDKFPDNANMEPLLRMTHQEAVAFLNDFYIGHAGKYTLE